MKKSILLICLSLFVINYLKSQTATVKLGPKLKDSKRSQLSGYIGKDDQNYFVGKATFVGLFNYDNFIESLNSNLEKENSVELTVREKNRKVTKTLGKILMLDDKIFTFFIITDLESKTNSFVMNELNKSSLLSENEDRTLFEYSFEDGSKRNTGGFGFDLSYDSSKVLIYHSLPYSKDNPERFGLAVFDKKLNKLWDKEIELPYEDKLFSTRNFQVNNEGKVFILGKLYEDKAWDKKRGEVNYAFHVLSYSKNEKENFDIEVDPKSNFFNEMTMSVNTNNEVVCVGFYSADYSSVSEGSFYVRIDSKTKKKVVENFMPFSELVQENENENDSERKKRENKTEYT